MAPHSSTLAWKIPWTEEPGRLQSMGSWRVRHDWATSLSLFTFMHWRRKWQPTPVFLPGESQGQRSLVGCHLWGHTESDTTEVTRQPQQQQLVISSRNSYAIRAHATRWIQCLNYGYWIRLFLYVWTERDTWDMIPYGGTPIFLHVRITMGMKKILMTMLYPDQLNQHLSGWNPLWY